MPPRIVTARSMGLQFRANQLAPMGPERSVVGHYSAGARAADVTAGIERARSFHRDHLARGWAGIGYHYLIPDDGAIVCCRSTFYTGAHVLSNNSGRIGVNMPGTVGDRPTTRQARALDWLLRNAHTTAMPRAHRTDRNLHPLPRFGHKDLMATSCPGLFHGMYLRGGDPWVEPALGPGDPDLVRRDPPFGRGFAALEPCDEEFLVFLREAGDPPPAADETGPDGSELVCACGDDELELPQADPRFDEDLTDVLAAIEGEQQVARA
jgi:N-acetylmuramoyl-L-alanine amidase-like protein